MPRNDILTPPTFNDYVPDVATHNTAVVPPVYATESLQEVSLTTQVQTIIFDTVWPHMVGVSTLLSLALVVAIVYAVFRVKQIRAAEDQYYSGQAMTAEAQHTFGVGDAPAGGAAGIVRWNEVQRHMQSPDMTGWKQAILEADIMLDDVITSRGYTGDGIGEKMKQVSRADIHSIDDAWEAHKVRNRIAHEGSDFDLSQRDARRIVNLYGNVFKELGYIPD